MTDPANSIESRLCASTATPYWLACCLGDSVRLSATS